MTNDAIFGAAARIEEMRNNQVKGNLVLSRRWFLAERGGPEAVNRVTSKLAPAALELLERTVMPFAWYPFGLLMDIDAAIASEVMGGNVTRMRDFGHDLGMRDIEGVYRVFLSVASPVFALSKVSALGSLYFRESTLAFISTGRVQGEVELVGRSMPLYMCQYGIVGWLTAVLEVAKATGIEVVHTSCVHEGAFRCRWHCDWAFSGRTVRSPSGPRFGS
ncbi:MAG TPA: hypothetical protein VK762_04260 [Polyangiaceae bacterium]|jgi:hypothetical protein|nr:hypothetical protein [Polyangiaceae bacterium]